MEIHGEKEHHWDVIDDHLKDGNNFSSLDVQGLDSFEWRFLVKKAWVLDFVHNVEVEHEL